MPDNEKYEGSVVLLFDEHNHPVSPEKVDPGKLKKGKYQWRRSYQLVSIIHTNRRKDFFVPVVMRASAPTIKLIENFGGMKI